MDKTRDLIKKIGDIKGTSHAKIGMLKYKNGKDITEAEEIKKKWQEYTGELYKKDLHDLDNHDGVVTHLEPDILECEVKWALGNITMNKTSEGNEIPAELFQILKNDAVKVLHSICQQIWENSAVATGLEKVSFHSNPKESSNYHMIVLISHASKVCSKSFRLDFSSIWTENFQMYKLDLEKSEEPEIKLLIFTVS